MLIYKENSRTKVVFTNNNLSSLYKEIIPTCNPSTCEVEAEVSQIPRQHGLHWKAMYLILDLKILVLFTCFKNTVPFSKQLLKKWQILFYLKARETELNAFGVI